MRFWHVVLACVLLLTPVRLALAQPVSDEAGSILVDYQKKEAFRDRVRKAVLHLQAEGKVAPGFDPDFPPRVTGAATLVRLPDGREFLVTAASLVENSRRIVIVRSHGRHSAARFVKVVAEGTLALLQLEDRKALGDLEPLPLDVSKAALSAADAVFSLDNLASGFEVLVSAIVAADGEPPLTHLRLVSVELTGGHPLITPRKEVAGFCFRPYTPTDRRCFAVRSVDLLKALPKKD